MIWFFLTSGLFLGWSLGANDGVNVFGTAVSSRMVKFKLAALIAGTFIILGAVISGGGTTRTLTDLGAVNALAGSFTVALAAGIAVASMTRLKLPVSTSQAIVGGIIGWNLFTGSPTDTSVLSKIVMTWVVSLVLSAVFAFILFKFTTIILKKIKIHILHLDYFTRMGLIVVGAFASYSLGASNIANVMGMFVNASPFESINVFDLFHFSGTQQLFLIGGIAIAVGIYTYGYKVMVTVGNQLFKITPITGLIVVLAESLVLFLFASEGLETLLINNGLPPIPLVPLSSTQVVIGAVVGVGLAKGGGGINYKILGKISIGWVAVPIIAALISFVTLFFVQNVFEQKVVQQIPYKLSEDVIDALGEQNIQKEPLLKLKNSYYLGSANFRYALSKQQRWNEDQLFLIFSYAALDSFLIDSSFVKETLKDDLIMPERLEVLKKLHGQIFVHKWQLEKALADSGNAWKTQSGKGAKLYNKILKREKYLVFDTFRIKSKIIIN